jgi:IclR family pca regulon transcriptional regulator
MPRLNERDAIARSLREFPHDAADFSEALMRGLRVITAFDADRRRMTLAEAARAVDLPRATVRRTLNTLVYLGYMTQEGCNYELTPQVLQLAAAYLASNTGSAVLQPACERVSAMVGETCSVAVLDGQDVVMIARAAVSPLINVGVGVGHRLPAMHTALGRVLLAALEDEQLDEFLASAQPQSLTSETVTDIDRLRSLILSVRAGGYAYVAQEAVGGFQSVAVPLRRWDGRTVAAMNIGASTRALDEAAMRGPMLDTLRRVAQELRAQLI